jgi:hypothetical protein
MFKTSKITNKSLYWGLIITFIFLYICVGFVSTLHSITFFNLTNATALAILLALCFEVGQASVLFGLLMTRNKDKFLPWALMILLTALQVTANVYASFKFMANSGNNDWEYWQKSILIGVQASNPEMYQIIISWIAGALLPIVALGMTALVAENIKLAAAENELDEKKEEGGSNKKSEEEYNLTPDQSKNELDKTIEKEVEKRLKIRIKGVEGMHDEKREDNSLITETKKIDAHPAKIIITEENLPEVSNEIEEITSPEIMEKAIESTIKEVDETQIPKTPEIEENYNDGSKKIPLKKERGWHLKKTYIDSNGDVYHFGKISEPQAPKKA